MGTVGRRAAAELLERAGGTPEGTVTVVSFARKQSLSLRFDAKAFLWKFLQLALLQRRPGCGPVVAVSINANANPTAFSGELASVSFAGIQARRALFGGRTSRPGVPGRNHRLGLGEGLA